MFSFNNPARDVSGMQRTGAHLHLRSGKAHTRSHALLSARLRRVGRQMAGDGTLAQAYLSRRGRNSASASTASRTARSWKPPGKNSIRRSNTPCSGAQARSTSLSHGGAGRRATNGAANSKASSQNCSINIAPQKAASNAASWKSTCASSAAAPVTASGSIPRPVA